MPRKGWNELSAQQKQVLEAALILVNGGLGAEEALGYYQEICDYVGNSSLDAEEEQAS